MEKKRPGFEDILFSGVGRDSHSGSDFYENASDIANDLKSSLLAEVELREEIIVWKKNLSLLCSYGWLLSCANIVKKLVQLRETAPLDIVAVSGLTERVYLRPLVCSLALAMRRFLQRVVMVDCNLRSPSLHTVTDSEATEGFIDMVKYGCSFFTAATETEEEGIYLIPAGSHPVSSEEELMGRELERVFHSLRAKADMTFVCVPPFLADQRVNPILSHMDGVLLCVNRTGSRRAGIRKSFSKLWQSDIPVVGIVSEASAKLEARQTVELHAQVEKCSAESETRTSAVPPVETRDENDVQRPHVEEASGKEGAPCDEEATHGEEAATPGERPQDEKIESRKRTPSDESKLVETELFGEKPRRRLPYIMGICVAAGIIGTLFVLATTSLGPENPEVDSRTLRSMLLPGSDGVTTADESAAPESEQAQSSWEDERSLETATSALLEPQMAAQGSPMEGQPPAAARANRGPQALESVDKERRAGVQQISGAYGAIYLHVSSFKGYENAARDSLRLATAGFTASIVLVPLDGLGEWYRVRVGPFDTLEEAETIASRIESLGLSGKPRIISEGVRE